MAQFDEAAESVNCDLGGDSSKEILRKYRCMRGFAREATDSFGKNNNSPSGENMNIRTIPFVLLSCGLIACTPAPGGTNTKYTITDLGLFAPHAINSSGQIAGQKLVDGTTTNHAFLYSNGILTDLGSFGGDSSASAINKNGQIVGVSNTADGSTHLFLYSNGVMTDLSADIGTTDQSYPPSINDNEDIVGTSNYLAFLYNNGSLTDLGSLPGSGLTYATDINNSGQIVGSSHGGAFLYSNGAMTSIGSLTGSNGNSTAYAINDSGQVVGTSPVPSTPIANPTHAFLYSNGTMKDIGTLSVNASNSFALAINAGGDIVGYSCVLSSVYACPNHTAFIYNGGSMKDLNTLLDAGTGWTLLEAHGINDSGQIVGTGTINGETHGFLMTPKTTTP